MVWFYLPAEWVIYRPRPSLSIPLWSDFIIPDKNKKTKAYLSFQSHYGLILSWLQRTFQWLEQCTSLSIPLWSDFIAFPNNAMRELEAFNPTMVWFYLTWDEEPQYLMFTAFNPTMVWFYQELVEVSEQLWLLLSIPLWSDFILSEIVYYVTINLSIPLWSDFISTLNCWATYQKDKLSIPLWSDFIYNGTGSEQYNKTLSIPLWSDFIGCLFWGHRSQWGTFNPTMVWFYLVERNQ